MKINSSSLFVLLAIPAFMAACSFSTTSGLISAKPTLTPAPEATELLSAQVSIATPTSTQRAVLTAQKPVLVRTTEPPALVVQTQVTVLPGNNNPSVQSPLCDLVSAGVPVDVTIPDGTLLQPAEQFSKTWRLINSGSCPWDHEYSVVWFSGQQLGVANQQFFSDIVQPGRSVDITVDMHAPEQPGGYQSNWKLRNPSGKLIGLGPNGDAPFWVRIIVIQKSSDTPAPNATSSPVVLVYAKGSVSLVLNDSLDLDSGELDQDGAADFRFETNPQESYQFVAENGASLGIFGNQEPSQGECQTTQLSDGTLVLTQISQGVYICYRTSQGLPGFAYLISSLEQDHPLLLDFVTWSIP